MLGTFCRKGRRAYLNNLRPGVKGSKERSASLNALLSCGNDVICEGRRGNRMQCGSDCKKWLGGAPF